MTAEYDVTADSRQPAAPVAKRLCQRSRVFPLHAHGILMVVKLESA
jgi:hypothetical protein